MALDAAAPVMTVADDDAAVVEELEHPAATNNATAAALAVNPRAEPRAVRRGRTATRLALGEEVEGLLGG